MKLKIIPIMLMLIVLGMVTAPSFRVFAADENEGGESGSGGDNNSGDSGGSNDDSSDSDTGGQDSSSSNDGSDDSGSSSDSKSEETTSTDNSDSSETVNTDTNGGAAYDKLTPEQKDQNDLQGDIEDDAADKQGAIDRQEAADKEGKTSNCGGVPCTGTEKEDSFVTPLKTSPGPKCTPANLGKDGCHAGGVKHPGDFGKGKDGPENMCEKYGGHDCGGHGGCNEKWNKDWNHNGKCDGHGDDGHDGHDGDGHDHHNDWCDHHDCHHHNHHSSTHFSDSHHGDVTVKVDTSYGNTHDLNDVHLIIGDVYDKDLDLSDRPDIIKVDNLDIDGGDDFAVCLANEDSNEGDCVVTHASSDHDTVEVHLKVF